MLTCLTLHNLALIEQHDISFDGGFNVITGETGAGKSLILEALSLCVGERADATMVRHGADEAEIFAEFDVVDNPKVMAWLTEHDRDASDDTLFIRRKISVQGRSKSWINGVPASISELKSLGATLVSIHSQHSGLELLKPQFVIDWLDDVAQLHPLKSATKDSYHAWQTLIKQADDIRARSTQRADRMALLATKIADVEPALNINFDDIESEYDELSNLEALMQDALQASMSLDGDDDRPSALSLLAKAQRLCDHQADKARIFDECSQLLALAHEQISEAASRLMDYAEQSLPDQARLDELNTLLTLAHRLSGKYHTPIHELLQEATSWQSELDSLAALPDTQTLDKELEVAYDTYLTHATELSNARKANAPTICNTLQQRLAPLALPNATCSFEFEQRTPADYTAHGIDNIALLFSANVGVPAQPLHKVASGGELSRMALVMQVIASGNDDHAKLPMLVFDEVDVGISGGTAQIVGELLRDLGQHRQLLAITHQAQVAAAAHRHILVHKEHGEQTTSTLTTITGRAQIDELARMSGGVNITDATRAHVQGLLDDIQIQSTQQPNKNPKNK